MFIRGVLGKHVAVGSALEGLKAGLALDGKGGHVLPKIRGLLTTVDTGYLRISTGSLRRLCLVSRRCARASVVLCEAVSFKYFTHGDHGVPVSVTHGE